MTETQAPPHNLEAERSILGAVLIHNDAFLALGEHLRPSDFYRTAHQQIYVSMAALIDERNGAADFVTLTADLSRRGLLEAVGGPAYIASLVDGLPHAVNIGHYAALVREAAQLRRLITVGEAIVSTAYAAKLPVLDQIATADRALLTVQPAGRSGLVGLRHQTGTGGLFADLEHRVQHKGTLSGIGTGFTSLNELTSGWQAGDLVVIAARPSIGKTAFAVNTAMTAARAGKSVAIFSLEMRRRQLEYRMLAGLSGVVLSKILSGYIADVEYAALSQALTVLDDLRIHLNDCGGQSVGAIRTACRRLKSDEALDLVVIDYVQLMPSSLDRKGATRNEEVTDISRRLKVLADELAVPVLVCSQLNRAAEGRSDPRPRLSDLRESGALEQDADIVLFLHRKDHREDGATACILEKQRNGATGTVQLTLDRDLTLFTDGGQAPVEPVADVKAERRGYFARRAHSR